MSKASLDKKIVHFFWSKQRRLIILTSLILVSYFLFFLFFAVYGFFQISSLWAKKQSLSEEYLAYEKANQLSSKKNTALLASSEQINTFLPDSRDIFSSLAVIENISKRTGFVIQSYSLGLDTNKKSSLSENQVYVKGVGTKEQFLNFLKDYKYVTGQLITINKVNLSAENNVISNLTINLYSYSPKVKVDDLSPNIRLDQSSSETLEQIAKYAKTEETGVSSESAEINTDYTAKEDPFMN